MVEDSEEKEKLLLLIEEAQVRKEKTIKYCEILDKRTKLEHQIKKVTEEHRAAKFERSEAIRRARLKLKLVTDNKNVQQRLRTSVTIEKSTQDMVCADMKQLFSRLNTSESEECSKRQSQITIGSSMSYDDDETAVSDMEHDKDIMYEDLLRNEQRRRQKSIQINFMEQEIDNLTMSVDALQEKHKGLEEDTELTKKESEDVNRMLKRIRDEIGSSSQMGQNLQKKLENLQKLLGARNRFGCWLCNGGTGGNSGIDSDEEFDEESMLQQTITQLQERNIKLNRIVRKYHLDIEGYKRKRKQSETVSASRSSTSTWMSCLKYNRTSKMTVPKIKKSSNVKWDPEEPEVEMFDVDQPIRITKNSHRFRSKSERSSSSRSRSRNASISKSSASEDIKTPSHAKNDAKTNIRFQDDLDSEEDSKVSAIKFQDPTEQETSGSSQNEVKQRRSCRQRMCTPFVSPSTINRILVDPKVIVEPTLVTFSENVPEVIDVPTFQPLEEQSTADSSTLRPIRDRLATPFFRQGDANVLVQAGEGALSIVDEGDEFTIEDPKDGFGVRFADTNDNVEPDPEISSHVSPSPRSARNRMQTPFVNLQTIEGAQDTGSQVQPDESRTVNFDTTVEIQNVHDKGDGTGRSVRARVATPFFNNDMLEKMEKSDDIEIVNNPKNEKNTIRFHDCVDVEETPTSQGTVRSTRQRVQTPFISQHALQSTTSESIKSNIQFDEIVDVQSPKPDYENNGFNPPHRPIRNRIATPFFSPETLDKVISSESNTKYNVSFNDQIEIKNPSRGSNGEIEKTRPTRQRLATPFLKDVITEEIKLGKITFDAHVSKQISSATSTNKMRPIRNRLETPFITQKTTATQNDVISEARRPIKFDPEVSTCEHRVPKCDRPIRSRIATPFLNSEILVQGIEEISTPDNPLTVTFSNNLEYHMTNYTQDDGHECPIRRCRERLATPFIKVLDATETFGDLEIIDSNVDSNGEITPKATVGFSLQVETRFQASDSKTLRPARSRMATPFVDPNTINRFDREKVHFSEVVHTVENKEDITVKKDHTRPVRDRIATPFLNLDLIPVDDLDEKLYDSPPKNTKAPTVNFGNIPEKPEEDNKNDGRCRKRLATPFCNQEKIRPLTEKIDIDTIFGSPTSSSSSTSPPPGIKFQDTADVQHIRIEEGITRPVRSRIQTPFITEKDIPLVENPMGIQFSNTISIVGIEEKNKRPFRSRQDTPFLKLEQLENMSDDLYHSIDDPDETEHVRFGSEVILSPIITEGPLNPIRDRLNTPYISSSSAKKVGFQVEDSVSKKEIESDDSKRKRHTESTMAETLVDTRYRTAASVSPTSVTPSSSRILNSPSHGGSNIAFRGKMDEGRVDEQQLNDTPTSRLSASSDPKKQVELHMWETKAESMMEHKFGEALRKVERQQREDSYSPRRKPSDLIIDKSDFIHNPDALLFDRLISEEEGTISDNQILLQALKQLEFCDGMEQSEIEGLAEAMNCYRFSPGEVVCIEGDISGTHFFILRSGQLLLTQSGAAGIYKYYNQPGTCFGESVFFLHGVRKATIQVPLEKDTGEPAEDTYLWGIEGHHVRDVIKYMYITKQAELGEVLRRDPLGNLPERSRDLFCERTYLIHYKKGDIIADAEKINTDQSEGRIYFPLEPSSISINYGTPIIDGKEANTHFGESAVLFGTQTHSAIAVEDCTLACLTKLDAQHIFGTAMERILIRNVVQSALENEPFSKFTMQARESLGAAAPIFHFSKDNKLILDADILFFIILSGTIHTGSTTLDVGDFYTLNGSDDIKSILQISSKVSLMIFTTTVLKNVLHHGSIEEALEYDTKRANLESIYLFKILSKEFTDLVVDSFETITLQQGEKVTDIDTQADTFYLIKEGQLSVTQDGKEVKKIIQGESFGERGLLYQDTWVATYTVETPKCILWKLRKHHLEKLNDNTFELLQDRYRMCYNNFGIKDLIPLNLIGKGTYGPVKLVQHKQTGTKYFLKVMRKSIIKEHNHEEAIRDERTMLAELDHPFIARLVRTFRDRDYVYIVRELILGGQFLDALDALDILNVPQAQFYVGSLILALEYLHHNDIIYRDIKSENILLDKVGYIKLFDFTTAKKMTTVRTHTFIGTPHFIAPEVIKGKGYGFQADAWSLGICMYEFMCGTLPFGADGSDEWDVWQDILYNPLVFPKWFKNNSEFRAARNLIQNLLHKIPSQRALISEPEMCSECAGGDIIRAKTSPFFKDFYWDALISKSIVPPLIPDENFIVRHNDQDEQASPTNNDPIPPTVIPQRMSTSGALRRSQRVSSSRQNVEPPTNWDVEF